MRKPFVGKDCITLLLLLLAGNSVVLAQQYTISTVAGGAPPTTPAPALNATIGVTHRVTTDSSGNVYFSAGNCVYKVTGGSIALVAGNSRAGYSGDNGAATAAQLNSPQGLVFDSAKNLYIADSGNNRVRMVNPSGVITTFAGNGTRSVPNFLGDGGPATQANLYLPSGLAVDSSGNIYIADTGDNVIRKVTTDGNIATVAGNGFPAWGGDTFAATMANLNKPQDVAVDSSGNIYIADTANAYIRKVTTDGIIHSIIGNGAIGYSGDGGPASSAGLIAPFALAFDSSGNMYIAENGDSRIRKVDSKGNISTIAGTGLPSFQGDNGPAIKAQLYSPTGVTADSSGNVYVADSQNLRVRQISSSGNISTIAGSGGMSYSGDNGPATSAQLNAPQGVAVFSVSNLGNAIYIADTNNDAIREVLNGKIITVAGNGSPGNGSQLNAPQGVAVDKSGNVFIADTLNHRVLELSNGALSTVAGTGTAGYSGDGGSATSAALNLPWAVAVDRSGNLYIADAGNHTVRKVSSSGAISTLAGNGTSGYTGDGGPAAGALLNSPQGIAVDSAGNVYISDTGNYAVREVTANGQINTIAGNGGAGYSGDGGFATQAQLLPLGIAVDSGGYIYVADGGTRVRRFAPGGFIQTIAGNGAPGYSGDGGLATNAQLNAPTAVAVDAAGEVFVADTTNNAIRLLRPSGSAAVTLAAVTNAASNQVRPISPGEAIVLYGTGLGPANLVMSQFDPNGILDRSVAGTTVFVNGVPAPVLYTSSAQVAAIVPYEVSGPTAQVVVIYQAQSSVGVSLPVTATSPSIFTLDGSGAGQAVAVNDADGSLNGPAHPVSAGQFITIYATGTGQTAPAGQDGVAAPLGQSPAVIPVTASIGSQQATVSYAGGAPGIVAGITQINIIVPTGLTPGNNALTIQTNGVTSQNNVTIAIK